MIPYAFKRPELLKQALTHRSHSSQHNERFEFLGDSILDFVITCALFERYPNLSEGDLSMIRSQLVSKHDLIDKAKKLHLEKELFLGKSERKKELNESFLADAFEAILGAIYLDGGLQSVQLFIQKLYQKDLNEIASRQWKPYKTQLQEYCQAHKIPLPSYQTTSQESRQIIATCSIKGHAVIRSTPQSHKKAAEEWAAKQVLQTLKERT